MAGRRHLSLPVTLGFHLAEVAWRIFYEVHAKQKKLSQAEFEYIHPVIMEATTENKDTKVNWFKLFSLKQTWAFIVGKFFTDPVWYFLFLLAALLFQQHLPS